MLRILARPTAGGQETIGGGHLHNLYLALPMMYGWVGALAYILLFLVVVFRLLAAVRRYPFSNLSTVTCLGFLVSLAFFLIDEVKSGNAVQTINYGMVVWIWLGLGLAAYRTLKVEALEERMRRLAARARPAGTAEESLPDEDDDQDPPVRGRATPRARRA